MTVDSTRIARFYDAFVPHQRSVAFNERHQFLMDVLVACGLRDGAGVLELGCGIGVITTLIASRNRTGPVHAVDLSPASVEVARSRLSSAPNVTFHIADIVDYALPAKDDLDFITLFDVLEHVPAARHPQLFENLSSHMHENTQLVVNIPSHGYLTYLHEHEPESLQIVDQPLRLEEILRAAEPAGLRLTFCATYGIWLKGDYQLLHFRKRLPFVKTPLAPISRWQRRWQRLICRVGRGPEGHSFLWWLGAR